MPCYSPLHAFSYNEVRSANGKRQVNFSNALNRAFKLGKELVIPPDSELLKLPCGRCVGCRLERSRQWAVRCMHEASLHDRNCFITLTYASEHLPSDNSLHVEHFQLFMKRLRKQFGSDIRFFHCGEYGERYKRPHYHACLFNFDFDDRVQLKVVNGIPLYESETLKRLWPFGISSVGEVTFESAAYVARYIMKKVTGEAAVDYYDGRKPEYTTMSRRPGIAKGWFDKYHATDVLPTDSVVITRKGENVEMKPPRYYDSQFELIDPELSELVKVDRVERAKLRLCDTSHSRLKVREKCRLLKISRLVRTVDQEL